jgi:hypothetical protein
MFTKSSLSTRRYPDRSSEMHLKAILIIEQFLIIYFTSLGFVMLKIGGGVAFWTSLTQ